MLVFVYGTLKKDKCNAHNMTGAKYLREFTLPVKGFLYWNTSRNYPHFISDDTGAFISGELYDVDEILVEKLDYFEGHPTFFKRNVIPMHEGDIYYYEYIGYIKNKEKLDKDFIKISKY